MRRKGGFIKKVGCQQIKNGKTFKKLFNKFNCCGYYVPENAVSGNLKSESISMCYLRS